jgi:L-2-hydroxyglutarate oxidase LhgO
MDFEIAVIGGGVVGLAIAGTLSRSGREVVIIEKEDNYGRIMSSRNSEVIHAGIYYPVESLKSRLCISGREMLYSYLEEKNLPHSRCGKLIVAADNAEKEYLRGLLEKAGKVNGKIPLELINEAELKRKEPNVRGVAALWSPQSGILDVHSYMDALAGEFRGAGGEFAFRQPVTAITGRNEGYEVTVGGGVNKETISFEWVINAAGLMADEIARLAGFAGDGDRLFWCKGNYFRLRQRPEYRVSHLIYPVPPRELEGLGIHATIDLGGGVRFGPDVNYLEERVEDYAVEEKRKTTFVKAIHKYMPQIREEDLSPDMAGIRGKRQGPGEPFKDFIIRREPGTRFINLIGIESPGLTASLAIARYVKEMLER